MGLTKEQWKKKRIDEIAEIVKEKGKKIDGGIIYYCGKEPLIIKDICVDGIALKNGKLIFADYVKGDFNERRNADDVERKYLEEILSDLK